MTVLPFSLAPLRRVRVRLPAWDTTRSAVIDRELRFLLLTCWLSIAASRLLGFSLDFEDILKDLLLLHLIWLFAELQAATTKKKKKKKIKSKWPGLVVTYQV